MKYDLIIKDVSHDEAQNILNKIGAQSTVAVHSHAPAATVQPNAPHVTAAAPIPPVTTAGNLPQANTVADNSTGGIDSEGLPWDARIHSSSKKTNANGTWARRRNVDDGEFHRVVAELRSRGSAGNAAPSVGGNAPTATHFVPPAPMNPAMPPSTGYTPPMPPSNPNVAEPALPAFLQHGVPPATGGPVNTPPHFTPAPPPPAPPASQNINDLFNKIQQLFSTGAADANYINSLTGRLSQRFQLQVNSINDIANRPEMIADAFMLIATDGK